MDDCNLENNLFFPIKVTKVKMMHTTQNKNELTFTLLTTMGGWDIERLV